VIEVGGIWVMDIGDFLPVNDAVKLVALGGTGVIQLG